MSFINKVVLVTGAGSGIGQATAIHFAKLSARLALVDKNKDELAKTVEQCEKVSKVKVFHMAVDLTNDADVKRVVDDTAKEYGRIDVLMNCAGIHGTGGILDPNILNTYDRILAVNLRSIVAMTSFAAPLLVESKGVIINLSSISSILVTKDTLAYNTAKAGLAHFTRGVALELASSGVRVNSISPGPVRTNILTNAGMSEAENEMFWESNAQAVPLKRVIRPEEIAELAAFLASDKAASITGSDYVIDGGVVLLGSQDPPKLPTK